MPTQDNTQMNDERWWLPPRTEAEDLALGYVTLARQHAERIVAFALKYPESFHLVRQIIIEAEFAASEFGRRMEEEEASLEKMKAEADRLLRSPNNGNDLGERGRRGGVR